MVASVRVLIVDPSDWFSSLTTELPGPTIGPVAAEEALTRLRQDRFDVALVASDLGPGRRGVDLVREAVQQGCGIPLVLVAACADDRHEEAALRAGAAAVIDASHADARDLSRVVRFVDAGRRREGESKARLLQDLSSYLAHEGRNALAGIRGAVQVVSDHLPRESADRTLCDEIRERVAKFAATLDSLTLVLHPLEPVRAVVPLARVLQDEARRLDARVRPIVVAEDLAVSADPEQLALMFGALFENAAEAVDGEGEVRVTLKRDGEWCVVEVSDSGPALARTSADLNRMLELFTTSKGVRAGLGLPLAKQIAEAHGGTIELGWTPSSALRVTVRLPLSDELDGELPGGCAQVPHFEGYSALSTTETEGKYPAKLGAALGPWTRHEACGLSERTREHSHAEPVNADTQEEP